MSYRGLVLSGPAVEAIAAGVRDLPLTLVPTRDGLDAGRPVRLLTPTGEPLGVALADPENDALRVYSDAAEPAAEIGPALLAARVRRAWDLRDALGISRATAAYRVVHGAADGLGGFAADVYGEWAVLYAYGRAFVSVGRLIADALRERGALRGVVLKIRGRGEAAEAKSRQEFVGETPPEALVVEEHGVPFEVHLMSGLNVGLFTDMREHRHALARLAAGRRVLNGFSYTGSLSVCAARAGAASVTSVDLSSGVQRWAQDNFRLSGIDPAPPRCHFATADVGRYLAAAAHDGRTFDLILLDPPSYSAARGAPWSIERDYPVLIARACTVLAPNGFLWLAANTRHIDLTAIAGEGIRRARRFAQVLETGGLPADYPTLIAQPDDRYLRVQVLRVA